MSCELTIHDCRIECAPASRERYYRPLIQMLEYAQEFTSKVDFTDLQAAHAVLTACNAFERHRSLRLLLPAFGRPDDGPAPGFSPRETRRPKTMD